MKTMFFSRDLRDKWDIFNLNKSTLFETTLMNAEIFLFCNVINLERLDEFRRAGRGGMGVKALKVTETKGNLVGARSVDEDTEVMLMSTGGTAIRCAVKQIKQMSRAAQGVRVMKLSSQEEVSAFIPIKS